jgi:class 3 adenylate cyclase
MPIRVLELHHHVARVAPADGHTLASRDFYVNVLGMEQCPSHCALGVADLTAARAHLDRLGIEHCVASDCARQGPHAIFLRDPIGNLIELHEIDACRCSLRTPPESPNGYARAWGAVMFADMRGFTTLAERLAPDQVVPLLNEYFALLTGIAVARGGTVFGMTGDALIAGFGVPRAQSDAPERAVDAAREMLLRFRELARDWKRRLDVDTGLGIGINAGEMVAGNVGAPSFMSYTVIGDTVNVAARLSQRARAGEALLSRTVKRSLEAHGHEVPVVELPALRLRGRAAPIDIYCMPTEERLDFRPAFAAISVSTDARGRRLSV